MMKAILSQKYILSLLLMCISSALKAQVTPTEPSSTGVTEDINVVRAYKPLLADAVKIRRSPSLEDTRPFKPNLTYTIVDKKLELNTDIRQLQAQQLAEDKAFKLINNYVKAGAGNFNTGFGELSLNTGQDEALQAGVYFKHLGQQGSLKGQDYSGQQFRLFGRSIQNKFTVKGETAYDGQSSNFYGANPAIIAPSASVQKQRYDVFSLKGELLKKYEPDSKGLDYAVKTDSYVLKNSWHAVENSFLLSTYLSKTAGVFSIGTLVSLDFTGTKDSLYSIANNIARANPFIRLKGAGFSLTIGANVIQEFGDNKETNVLPSVTAEIQIIPNFTTLFGGYTGDVLKSSVRQFSRENPYLNQNVTLKNALQKSNIYGGVRGNAGSGFGYKASMFYKTIENMPLFVNSRSNFRKFDVVYDSDTKIMGVEGEMSVNTSGIISWIGKATINSYEMGSEDQAWFKPGLVMSSNLRFALNRKLSINGEAVLTGDTKALTYDTSPIPQKKLVSVKSFVDLSAGAEYRFKERVGFYIQANNLFGTNYQRYLYYPQIGLNVFGGLSYSF